MLELATSPLHADYSPTELSPDEENNSLDWRQILREGESSPEPLGSESELSEWSDEDEAGAGPGAGATALDTSREEDEAAGRAAEAGDPGSWLAARLQPPYWERGQQVRVDSGHEAANIADITERAQVAGGRVASTVATSRVTEYQVTRELLWMAAHPAPSALFHLVDGEFRVAEAVTISSLTQAALRRLLGEVLETINSVRVLRTFLAEVEDTEAAPHTVEAYSESVSIVLEAFTFEVFKVESSVKKQETTVTLTDVLDSLRSWFNKIHAFKSLHDRATAGWRTSDNWVVSIRLLSVLYNSLATNHLTGLQPFIVDTFLRSFRPYLDITQVWLEEGRLEDWRQEFIFYRDDKEAEDDEQFWHKAFKLHPYREELQKDQIRPLKLLDGLDSKIFVSGKSVEIFSRLERTNQTSTSAARDPDPQPPLEQPRGLFTSFIRAVEDRLAGDTGAGTEKEAEDTPAELEPELQSIVESAEEPFLALAFQQVFQAAQRVRNLRTEDRESWSPGFLVPAALLSTMVPLELVLGRALAPIIERHYRLACSSLVHLVKEELQLEAVLSRARRVFFMEAGDLMHDFCSQLFTTLEKGEVLEVTDSASLTLLLQDCLGGRYPDWCDLFSCSHSAQDPASLSGLTINMAVSWPLTILLTQANLETYNKIFIFLAEVKRSLWSLQTVSLADLAALEDRMAGLEEGAEAADTSLCLASKQHRLQLLRAWLLHFTSTIHGYFMSRVVHSTEIELGENLAAATDLDMILGVHDQYLQQIHDRCFLHPSARMLLDAVRMVLNIGLELKQSVGAGLPLHTRTLLAWEEKYTKCHAFLAKTLQAMTNKKKVSHLEGLAVALLHSCPA